MPSFGTSENMVFLATGPIQLKAATAEVCPTCADSETGPHHFSVLSEKPNSATLICPNCGDQKTVLPHQVKMPETERAIPPGAIQASSEAAQAPQTEALPEVQMSTRDRIIDRLRAEQEAKRATRPKAPAKVAKKAPAKTKKAKKTSRKAPTKKKAPTRKKVAAKKTPSRKARR